MTRTLRYVLVLLLSLHACSNGGSKSSVEQAAGGSSGASGTGEAATSAGTNAAARAGASAASGGQGGSPSSGSAGVGAMSAAPAAGVRPSPDAGMAATAGAGIGSSAMSGSSAPAGAGASASAGGCTRELLESTVDSYFSALAAHDSSKVPLASNAKFTENGKAVSIGEGLWKTAGEARFKRSALDTQTCSTVTESVVREAGTDIVVGVRLKLADARITELETIVVRKGDYASNTMTLLSTASDDWETPLPADQRATREEIQGFVDRYFTLFPAGGCKFASDCVRYENGFTPGKCMLGLSCSMSTIMSRSGMPNRLSVIDVDAGIGVGFTMFQGKYTDFHMFKVRGGEVHGVHAVLAEADQSGW